jgi:phage FluMu protein Com
MTQVQSNIFIQLIDYSFATLCRACGAKVLDPEKRKGQTWLDGKCPSCHQLSSAKSSIDTEYKSKKQIKRELKRQRKAQRKAERRALFMGSL